FCVTPTGYMLTNRHVVERVYAESDVSVKIDDKIVTGREELVPVGFFGKIRCPATVVHVSSRFDLAILKVGRTRPNPYFGLASGDSHRLRTEAAVLGFPGVASQETAEESAMLASRFQADLRNALSKQSTVYLESR